MSAHDDARARADAARADARRRLQALKPPSLPPPPTMPPLPAVPPLPPTPPLPLPPLPPLPTTLSTQLDDVRRAQRRDARHRRTVAGLVAVIVVLLLALLQCPDEPPPLPPSVVEATCPEVPECGPGPKKKPTKPKPRRPAPTPLPPGRTIEQPRDVLAVPQLRSPAWLASLRLQVSARSLALASCFNGVEKPGALRLTATVTPSTGVLSDAELEPLGQGVGLDGTQRRGVLAALQSPAYRLGVTDEAGADVGTRISLILEF